MAWKEILKPIIKSNYFLIIAIVLWITEHWKQWILPMDLDSGSRFLWVAVITPALDALMLRLETSDLDKNLRKQLLTKL